MPHIELPAQLPGIVGPLTAYPETAIHLNGLAQQLLRGQSSLTAAERETIATRVSAGNECYFCTNSHASAARVLWGEQAPVLRSVVDHMDLKPIDESNVSAKLKALLHIADKVRQDARSVTPADITNARTHGADDKAIHDTVLIAAAFCMYNRYVDGLATLTPKGEDAYADMGQRLAEHGYGA